MGEAQESSKSSAKVTIFTASGNRSDDVAVVAEGAFAFHTVNRPSSYKTADCTSVLFKTIFPDSEIAR
jgi:hypothetical protein